MIECRFYRGSFIISKIVKCFYIFITVKNTLTYILDGMYNLQAAIIVG